MNVILNSAIILVPTLFVLFVHNYICHAKLTFLKKLSFFFLYGVIIGALMYGIAWMRDIKGTSIAHMTLSHKIEFTLLGSVMSFCIAFAVCLVAEKDIISQKLKMYLLRFQSDIRKYL